MATDARGRSRPPAAARRPTGEARADTALHLADVHGERFASGSPGVEQTADGFVFENAFRLTGDGWSPGGDWYLGVRAREEAARGLNDREDVWAAGTFSSSIAPGESHGLTAAAAPFDEPLPRASAIVAAARERAAGLVRRAGVTDAVDAQLVLAADSFAVETAGRPTAVGGISLVRRMVA